MKKSAFLTLLLIGFLCIFFVIVIAYQVATDHLDSSWSLGKWIGVGFLEVVFVFFAVLFLLWAGRYYAMGKPKTFLPMYEKFRKVSVYQEESGSYTYLWLLISDESSFRSKNLGFYKILTNNILNEDGSRMKEIPEEFTFKIGRRIDEDQKFEKYPAKETVYYLFPERKFPETEK